MEYNDYRLGTPSILFFSCAAAERRFVDEESGKRVRSDPHDGTL